MTARRLSRRSLLILFIIACVIGGLFGAYRFAESARPVLAAGPMLQLPSPRKIIITWNMTASTGLPDGIIRLESSNGDSRDIPAQFTAPSRYEAAIEDLPANLSHEYRVMGAGLFGSTHELAGPYPIKFPAPPSRPFRFIAFGDSGNGSNSQTDLAALIARSGADLIIHTGDLVYPAGDVHDYYYNFFLPNKDILPTIPFMPSLGNHDVATDRGKPLLDAFILPENGPSGIDPERNYYFDYGDARFVALDSNLAEGDAPGAMTRDQLKNSVAPWLRTALTQSQARWKFLFFHHPFYTGSQHSEGGGAHMKEAFLDLIDECKVDIVFCGHNHLYERTFPLRADQIVPDGQGTIYITTGAGGNSHYAEILPPPAYIRFYNDTVFNFTQVDLAPDELRLRQIDENNNTIDDFRLQKSPPSPTS